MKLWAIAFISLVSLERNLAAADFLMEAVVTPLPTERSFSDAFEGDPLDAPLTVSVAATSPNHGGLRVAEAAAASLSLQTFTSAAHTGLNTTTATARFRNAELRFQDSPALRALVSTGDSFVDLLLNFNIAVSTLALGPPGGVQQRQSRVTATLSASSSPVPLLTGEHTVANGLTSRTVTSTGFLSGLPENGGGITVGLPIRVGFSELSVRFSAHAESEVWAPFHTGTADLEPVTAAAIRLSLLDVAEAVTLPNGDPLSGVSYQFLPEPLVRFDGGAEPPVRRATPLGGGSSQANPILPNLLSAGFFHFFNAPTENWFDPPLASGFDYGMLTDDLFTGVLDFPTGFSAPFEIDVGGVTLPITFGPGESVHFADFAGLLGPLLVDGTGVRSFRLTGITPYVDGSSDLAFPLRLAFDAPLVDFVMTPIPVPEPSSLSLCCMGVIGIATVRCLISRFKRCANDAFASTCLDSQRSARLVSKRVACGVSSSRGLRTAGIANREIYG